MGAFRLSTGTEDYVMADSEALRQLEMVAKLLERPPESASTLKVLHRAKDQHIFRLMKSLTTPFQESSRALTEVPRRCASLGHGVGAWTQQLARRCFTGKFLNPTIVQTSAELALECWEQDDVPARAAFGCVKL